MKPKKPLYFVTKHYNEGMVHHMGRTQKTLRVAVNSAKRFLFRGRFRGKVVVRVWKLVEEIEVK